MLYAPVRPTTACIDTIDQPFILFTFGFAADAEMKAAVEQHVSYLYPELRAVGQRAAGT